MKRYARRIRWWYWKVFRPAKYAAEVDRRVAIAMEAYKQIIARNIFEEHPLMEWARARGAVK